MATALQLKDWLTVWLVAGNAWLALWSLFLYWRQRAPGPLFFQALLFFQLLIGAQVALGVFLFAGGLAPNSGHLMYGVLNAVLAVGRVFGHTRLVSSGAQGMLWHGLLSLLAIGLVARSLVTAAY
ncbi:MAG: hypothetical protein BAA04_08645 [Firmicutes bacterium ZCTH02-B6]|nr:MAG: hypothetical protein BAA04_08645 [Firmicutes bacterium ZCTH02-B6]